MSYQLLETLAQDFLHSGFKTFTSLSRIAKEMQDSLGIDALMMWFNVLKKIQHD